MEPCVTRKPLCFVSFSPPSAITYESDLFRKFRSLQHANLPYKAFVSYPTLTEIASLTLFVMSTLLQMSSLGQKRDA